MAKPKPPPTPTAPPVPCARAGVLSARRAPRPAIFTTALIILSSVQTGWGSKTSALLNPRSILVPLGGRLAGRSCEPPACRVARCHPYFDDAVADPVPDALPEEDEVP